MCMATDLVFRAWLTSSQVTREGVLLSGTTVSSVYVELCSVSSDGLTSWEILGQFLHELLFLTAWNRVLVPAG